MTILATQLHLYLKDRAVMEDVDYELNAAFFAEQLEKFKQPVKIFGVLVDDNRMISDEQEPRAGFFATWLESYNAWLDENIQPAITRKNYPQE